MSTKQVLPTQPFFGSLGVKRSNVMKLSVKPCHWNPLESRRFL